MVKAEQNEVDAPVVASAQTLSRPQRLAQLRPGFATLVVDEAHHATAPPIGASSGIVAPCGRRAAHPRRHCDPGTERHRPAERYLAGNRLRAIPLALITAGYLANLRAVQVLLQVISMRSTPARAISSTPRWTRSCSRRMRPSTCRRIRRTRPPQSARLYAHGAHRLRHGRGLPRRWPGGRGSGWQHARGSPAGNAGAPADGGHAGAGQLRPVDRGLDEPSIAAIVMARPTMSKPLYIQMLGRGTRLYPGKTDCLILDVVGASTRHALLTTAALFDVDPATLAQRALTAAVAARVPTTPAPVPAEPPAGTLVAASVDSSQPSLALGCRRSSARGCSPSARARCACCGCGRHLGRGPCAARPGTPGGRRWPAARLRPGRGRRLRPPPAGRWQRKTQRRQAATHREAAGAAAQVARGTAARLTRGRRRICSRP